jgi:hypothetical protein
LDNEIKNSIFTHQLKSKSKPIAKVFAETFASQKVYGTSAAVNYNSFGQMEQ